MLQLTARGWHDAEGVGVPLGVRVGVGDSGDTAVEIYAEQQPAISDDESWSLSLLPELMLR